MELESCPCFSSSGKLCGAVLHHLPRWGWGLSHCLVNQKPAAERSPGPKVHTFPMKAIKNPCVSRGRVSHLSRACLSWLPVDTSPPLPPLPAQPSRSGWDWGQLAPGQQSHQSPGTARLPLCHGRLVLQYLSRVEPHKLAELNEIHIEASRAWLSAHPIQGS